MLIRDIDVSNEFTICEDSLWSTSCISTLFPLLLGLIKFAPGVKGEGDLQDWVI